MKNGFHELLIHEISALCTMRACLLSSFCSNCSSDCLIRPNDLNLSSVFALKHLTILLLPILEIIALPDHWDWTATFAILLLYNRLALATSGQNSSNSSILDFFVAQFVPSSNDLLWKVQELVWSQMFIRLATMTMLFQFSCSMGHV